MSAADDLDLDLFAPASTTIYATDISVRAGTGLSLSKVEPIAVLAIEGYRANPARDDALGEFILTQTVLEDLIIALVAALNVIDPRAGQEQV